MFDIGVEQTEAGLHLGPVPKFFYQFRLGTGLTRGHELQVQMPGAPRPPGPVPAGAAASRSDAAGSRPAESGAGSPLPSWRATGAADGAAARPRPFQTLGAEITKGLPVGTEAFPQPQGLPDAPPRQVLPEARGPSSRPVPQGGRSCGPGWFHRRGGRDVVSFDHARFAGPHMLRMFRGLGSGLGGFRGQVSVTRAGRAVCPAGISRWGRAQLPGCREGAGSRQVRCCRQRRSFPPGSRVHGRGSPGPGQVRHGPCPGAERGLPSCLS